MEFSEVIEVLDRGSSIDVQSDCTFESLMIGKKTLDRLKASRFDKPSPVQAKAIPVGLLGRDMLVQAKSGTGKTLVFSVLAVENLDTRASYIQKVIITPTREISVQIKETVRKVAPTGARTSVFVGGCAHKLNVLELQGTRPQIVIGTPGRIAQLLKLKAMDISHVDFFVLDEADKLMDDVFRDDINFVINNLPPIRQVAVFSATYPRNLDVLLSTFLRDAALVRFNADDVQLVGVKQYVIKNCSPMFEKLTHVLKYVRYVQALVFCDQIAKCEPIAAHLKSEGLDVTFVSSAMSQKERQLAVDQLRTKRVKILVSSDLTARGIDADNVNLVVNVDAAANEETYFHRIGRSARFGAHGAAVTLLEDERALKCFMALAHRGKVTAKKVKDVEELPEDLVKNTEFWEKLNYFIEFDKSNKEAPRNRDLDKVPDRESAVEALQKEREASGMVSSYKYDRKLMVAMRPTSSVKAEEEVSEKLEKLSVIERGDSLAEEKENQMSSKDEENDKPVEKKSFNDRLEELKAQVEAKKKEVQTKKEVEKEKVETKPKFKFVPTRQKAKKKYYMRGELQHIRDAFTAEQWRAYAETKFDFSQEPFLDAFGSSGSSKNTQSLPSGGDVPLKTEPRKTAPSEPKKCESAPKQPKNHAKSNVIKYSRFKMIQIQSQVPKNQWLPYVKSKWDTSDEPWELDASMRCSYEERLRRLRWKEKEARKKVMEERKKKREEDRSELVSIGRTTQTVEIKETSWADYQKRVLRDFEEKTAKRKQDELEGKEKSLRKIGPVVPPRTSPLIYKYRVDMYKRRLDEQNAFLMQQSKLDDGKIHEMEIQTDNLEEKIAVQTADGECQTEEVKIQKIQEEEDIEDEECWDEEYWDEDEEEEYWDEEQEEEESVSPLQEFQEEQLAQLGAGYIRNINFQAAVQSYMDLMNSFSRRQ